MTPTQLRGLAVVLVNLLLAFSWLPLCLACDALGRAPNLYLGCCWSALCWVAALVLFGYLGAGGRRDGHYRITFGGE